MSVGCGPSATIEYMPDTGPAIGRRITLIVPNWLADEGVPSALRGAAPGLARFGERARLSKLAPLPPDVVQPAEGYDLPSRVTPELAWFGLTPDSFVLQDGPLVVSAFGADPPQRSVHYHLSLLSVQDGMVRAVRDRIAAETHSKIADLAAKLNTASLTIVKGEKFDHGLVWEEGSIEQGTVSAQRIEGREIWPNLPAGDGERLLRRFIDDSINLLTEISLNRERDDQGLAPINLLWPWGQGFRPSLPNLALRNGAVAWVESSSVRIHGLTRLVGYRHGDREAFGRGMKVRLDHILRSVLGHEWTIVVLDSFNELRALGRLEEAEWLTHEIDAKLIEPLWERARKERLNLDILAPVGFFGEPKTAQTSHMGLALKFDSANRRANQLPFDERSLEERSLSIANPWDLV